MIGISESLKRFCEAQELMRFAYTDGKDYPRAVPVWYVIIDGDYYFGTGATSAKWKAVERDPRVGWVIDGGPRGSYKGVSYRGRAEQVVDEHVRARVYDALGAKYFDSTENAEFIEIYGKVDDPDTVYLRLKAEDTISWEY